MRLHSSFFLVLPGVCLAAEVSSQSFETVENTTTYQDSQQDTTDAVTRNMEAEGFSLPQTEEGYVEQVNAEGEESDRPDWRKMLRNRGQCDTMTSNTFTVSGSAEEQAGEAEKAAESEQYETTGYSQGDGKADHSTGADVSGFPPPSVPHDPTRRKISPAATPYERPSDMRRYLANEDADAEVSEEHQMTETAVGRELGKKKKAVYVAEPVMKAPAPMMMPVPTKKAAPMFVEAAPTKKGRYLAAVDDAETQFETEHFETEQENTASERGLGKKKKVVVAPAPMKVAPPPPPPVIMAAPTKMAPVPMAIPAAPTKKGRYLAAVDEVEMQVEGEQFETEQSASASERSLGKKKRVSYVSQPIAVAAAPVMMAVPAPAPPPVVMTVPAPAPAPMAVRAAPSKAAAPLVVEAAPAPVAPAAVVVEAAPTKMASAPMVVRAAPTRPPPVIIEAAPSKMESAPMAIEAAAPRIESAPVIIESSSSKMESAPMAIESTTTLMETAPVIIESSSSKMESAPMAIEAASTTIESAPVIIESSSSKMESAPMAIEAASTEVESAPLIVEAASSKMDSAPMAMEATPMKARL
ncbi:dense granule protein GRA11, putative [Eimeria mitis]|uniref:Dense granule protein GRA11, putative n=1 Tax=Eimeria mitis TaxID=44415 RepID=U6KD27_9EIME|nr:dense granule protein GRA11, putative [Eimeria mitis]CDJ35834.1 dense granule protein GRA11, putative [Eimeria mitis]